MTTDDTRAVRDTALWLRILLVGLTGALPLFVVSLVLINVSYSGAIDFGQKEQRGNAFERPLERLFQLLPAYQAAVRRALATPTPDQVELSKARQQVDDALQAVAAADASELENAAQLSAVQREWAELEQAPLSVAAGDQATSHLLESVRGMIRYAGDRSNLVLDSDLDSYYLMDITLCALPQTEQRIADITSRVSAWLRSGQVRSQQTQIAVFAATLREADLERTQRDAQTALGEDARFNGVSASLQRNLPPAVERLAGAAQPFLTLLDRVAAGDPVPADELEAAGWAAHAESFRLFDTGAGELDRLLATRIVNIQNRRVQGYSIIVATLAIAAFVMALMMRSLLERDVTDRQRAEAVIKQSELRFSRIFDHSPIPITLSSFPDSRILAANDRFLGFSGFTREEVVGVTTAELGIYQDPSDRAEILERLRTHGHVHGREQAFRTKSGQICHSVLWIDVLTIGEERYILVVSLDVTEQKLAEKQQRELEEQLRQAQKLDALGTLAGGIAHDFNNILGAIISYSELSKMDNPGNHVLQANLDEVLRASARAANLVRQILSFSRHQKEERKALQLAPIIKEALSLLRASLPSTIALHQQIEAAVPDVLANPTQVHQIVMNLCTNAAHAMKGKQGRISIELSQLLVADSEAKPHVELQPGGYVRMTVQDTGHGMDAATSKRIFEPFFTTKSSGEGTGLGLSVVHGIVKEYGGVVTVDSELGRGTSLTIFLPAQSALEKPAPSVATELPRGNGQRVLFVDDEPVLGDVAEKMMQRLGYRATVFQSSETALAAFQKEPAAFDVLVSDLTMPAMTGVELALQVLIARPGLPVILVSGSSGQLTATELRKVGIRELLSKPLDYGTLARVLSQVLRSPAH